MNQHLPTPQADRLRQPDWYRTATRWSQLTFVEDDPIRYDPDLWLEIFRSTRSNAVCLSAGGYIAFYPSKVPLHYVSKDIGDTDPFGRLVDGARALGMHVMARVDPHAIHQDAADAHPEWIAVDRDGNKRRHWAYPDVWVTCAYASGYNTEFMPKVIKELARDYDIDAVFANRWQGHGICYCDACRDQFHAFSGLGLPREADADDPAYRAWSAWKRQVLSKLVVQWDEVVRAQRPHASFIPNMAGNMLMEFETVLIERHCPFLVVDHQGRHGVQPVWMAGRNGKRMRAVFPDRPAVLITSVRPEEPQHRWKDSVNTAPETEAWITDGTAHGMLPWYTKFNAVVPDRRWIAPVERAFATHAALEPALARTQPAAEIAILDAATTLRHHGWEARSAAEVDEKGFYHALVEAGLPFEFLSDTELGAPGAIDRFRLLILPNAVCLSDAQCQAIEAWVDRGGRLLVAGESATCDADATPRDRLGLEAALGSRMTARPRGPVKNTYVHIAEDHPLTAGYDGAERFIGGLRLMTVEAVGDAIAPLLYVPDFPDLPMEEVYPRDAPVAPALIARETPAGGCTVHIPWNIGATFHEVMAADHQRLIENAVRWCLGKTPEAEVTADGVVDLALREGRDETLALVTNLTNPMMMKGPLRRLYPVSNVQLHIVPPVGRRCGGAKLVASGRALEVATGVNGRLSIALPPFELTEAVQVTWA
ncbi:alpha-amylase family protein [Mesobacterium pallidum]|uniref:alpha-amylase family protein n=1 Tax=Mesobacterium pallidum TaxID=2872037 RepID=UPI001EE18410|nr:alpha-amylase family protein [Mesobacterium pallidum]